MATEAPLTQGTLPREGGRLLGRWGSAALEYTPALVLLVALVGLWELLVELLNTRPYILPAPSAIWNALLDKGHLLPNHIQATATEAVLGLVAAAVGGVLLAVLLSSIPLARRVLYPIIVTSQTVPAIVLAPLLMVWVGIGLESKLIVVALVGFFPIVVSTVDGLASADRDMVALVRSMGASRLEELRHVLIPSAIPGFFAGLKIAAAYAVIGAVIAEWVAAKEGLGIFIIRSQASFRIDQIFVAIAVIALLSIALFVAVHLLARAASPWKYANDKGENGS
ncbi:MAG: ABC transporter permease [Chloroflexi bacterium]|nr:ABC transporter permease [Chloroflexota bacterium]